MSIIKHISERHRINPGENIKLLYTATGNNICTVDLSILLDGVDTNAVISVFAVRSGVGNPTNNSSSNLLIFEYPIGKHQTLEIPKVLLDKGDRLFTYVKSTQSVNVRVSGIVTTRPMTILRHGILANGSGGNDPSIHKLYELKEPLSTYASTSIYINHNGNSDIELTLWVSENTMSGRWANAEDNVNVIYSRTISKGHHEIIEDLILAPGEKIYYKATNRHLLDLTVTGVVVSGKID